MEGSGRDDFETEDVREESTAIEKDVINVVNDSDTDVWKIGISNFRMKK